MPTLVVICFLIDLSLASLYALNYGIGQPSRTLTLFIDLDREDNLPTWYSSIQWFGTASLFFIFALANFRRGRLESWLLLLLPLIFLGFSLDEVAQLHELFGGRSDSLLPGGTRLGTGFSRTGIWMFLLGLPFAIFFGALAWALRTCFQRAPGAFVKTFAGVALMIVGAVGIESLANLVPDRQAGYGILQVFAEELCEMLGATVTLWGGYELLERHGFALKINGDDQQPPAESQAHG